MIALCVTLCAALPALAAGPAGAAGAAREDTLRLLVWSEYIPPEVIEGFTCETGIKVDCQTYASNAQLVQKFLASPGKFDLIQPSDYALEALIRLDKLQRIDWNKVPNIRHIGAQYKNLAHDPEQRFSAPYMTGTVGIVVNTERIKDPIVTIADVFQPRYGGRIVALDDGRHWVSWALHSRKIPVNDVRRGNLAVAREVIARWLPLVRTLDSDSPKSALLNGDADIGIVWSGEAALLHQHDRKFKYILPAEGALMYVDSFAIPSDAPGAHSAHLFINYVLRPDVSKLISDKFPYTNPNLEARRLLTREQLDNPASYPKAGKLEIHRDIGKSAADEIEKLWTDLKSKR